MITTPSYSRSFGIDYVHSLVATLFELERCGIASVWWPRVGDGPWPACRRSILVAEMMLRPQITHLLWVDGDIS